MMPVTENIVRLLAVSADIYTPFLLAIALIAVFSYWRSGKKRHGFYLVYCATVVYGWMFLDKYSSLWASAGLDYSTHTAVALALVIFVGLDKSMLIKAGWVLSLLAYGGVMVFLHYHSWGDIFSTAIIVVISLLPVFVWRKNWQQGCDGYISGRN